jgi:formylglycine-generating enzyme required for sulfatase activity
LLRRPPIAGWLDEHKDALKLRDDVLKEAKEWADRGEQPSDLVRRGERLRTAEQTATSPIFNSTLAPASNYLAACRRKEDAEARAAGRRRAAIYTLMVGVIVALTGVIFKEQLLQWWDWYIRAQLYARTEVWPYVKSDDEVAALKNGDVFRDCAKTSDVCQDMVVIPAGSFVMGSPDGKTPVVGLEGKPKSGSVAPAEKGRGGDEGPQHEVSIARFAVAKFDVTWEAWDRCVALGGCSKVPTDQGYGRGKRPLINVSWDEAKAYIDWLSRLTGKSYRLLTEAKWEYTARAGTQTTYYFGDAAICTFANVADQSYKRAGGVNEIVDCDDQFVFTSPTDSFPPNRFGLHDMAGNVFQWVQDCYVDSYADAPSDGSAVRDKEGCSRVLRGGSWGDLPGLARAARRIRLIPDVRNGSIGFRVARSLSPARTLLPP